MGGVKSAVAVVLLLATAPAGAETEFALSEASGTLHLAPDGRVSRADLDTELDAENEARIEALVQRWQFEPILENGEAVEATVRTTLVLVARTDGGKDGKTRVAVQDAKFFEEGLSADQRLAATLKPPKYPSFSQGTVGGTVYLHLLLRDDGTVAAVSLAGGWVTGRGATSDKTAKEWGGRLFDLARTAAEQWVFPVPQYAGCAVWIPVRFRMPVKGWVLARTLPADPTLVPGKGCASMMDANGRPASRRFILRTALPGLLPGRPG